MVTNEKYINLNLSYNYDNFFSFDYNKYSADAEFGTSIIHKFVSRFLYSAIKFKIRALEILVHRSNMSVANL